MLEKRRGEEILEQEGATDITVPRNWIAALRRMCSGQANANLFDELWRASDTLYSELRSPSQAHPRKMQSRHSEGAQRLTTALAPLHRERERLIRLGRRALAAMQQDPLDQSVTCSLYALTCLEMGDLTEATEFFGRDREDRGDAIASLLLYEWCQMSQQATMAAYLAWNREQCALEAGEDPLDVLEHMAQDHDVEAATAIYAAVIQYLRGNPQACLDRLDAVECEREGGPTWMRDFWQAMACASLELDERAQTDVQAAITSGLPPLLLLPLRWFAASRPLYFETHIKPLFITYGLREWLNPEGWLRSQDTPSTK